MNTGELQSVADAFKLFFSTQSLNRIATVLVILVAGYLAITIILALARIIARRRVNSRVAGMIEKIVKYGGMVVVLVNASQAAGIDLSAALGAAGIVGIAIGFAAQTSVSNIISGLFLFSEKSFEIGDVIQLENTAGTIESVDMLSVKIRTFDNRLVRIPNETMIKSNIVNVTRWPERRLDLTLTLPYGVDPTLIEALLRDTAMSVPSALTEPEPFFVIDALGPNGISIVFGVWFKKNDYLPVKNGLLSALLARFEHEGLRPAVQVISVLPPADEDKGRGRKTASRKTPGA